MPVLIVRADAQCGLAGHPGQWPVAHGGHCGRGAAIDRIRLEPMERQQRTRACDRALATACECTMCDSNLASLLMDVGEKKEAAEIAKEGVRLKPDSPHA